MQRSKLESPASATRRWAKGIRKEASEQAFRAKYGATIADWVAAQARQGTGLKEAVEDARTKAVKALHEQECERAEHARGLMDSVELIHRLRETKTRETS